MERRTQVLLGLGFALSVAAAGALAVTLVPSGPTLTETWASVPPTGASGNHHGPAVGFVDGEPLVYAPISGPSQGSTCRLVALDAASGAVQWRHQVPPAACTIHAVGDPTVAGWNGRQAVLVATTEEALLDLDPETGDVRERYGLSSYGYTPPQVVDLAPGGEAELLIVDARGTVRVFDSSGSVVWEQVLDSYVWARPIVGDLAGDGATRLALGSSDGRLQVWSGDGALVLEVDAPFDGSITWLTSGQLDDDPAVELVAATARGRVVAVDGATGETEWSRSLDSFAAVHAVGDAEADGTNEVYVTAADGRVQSLEGDTGRTLWEREVATTNVQMMPPPVLGDVTGDAVDDLVVASNDGRVVALDPASGTLVAEFDREAEVFERPTLADVDGDDRQEIFVIYADGVVVRLDFDQ